MPLCKCVRGGSPIFEAVDAAAIWLRPLFLRIHKGEMARILFIDDDAGGRQMATYNLRAAGHQVDEADDGTAGVGLFSPDQHQLVITDVKMPGLSGIDVTRTIRERACEVPILLITAFGTIETAVEAMKAGAYDFIQKPFGRNQLLMAVERALEHRQLKHENRELRRQLLGVERPIVAVSSAMKETLRIADRVARSDSSVLIGGESGTGKELIARRIHARSGRANGPFVAVNCAAIPGELIEAELFGHARGAFTGAAKERVGKFRQADGGTLLLDEVAEIPMPAQAKLLRVLQERVVDVLGSDTPVAVDVRIVGATNQNLETATREKRFREDLFFRLNVVDIHVPPLRERVQDIPALVDHFVAELAAGEEVVVPAEVRTAMLQRAWPGNVRELRNACERMVSLCEGQTLSVADLPVRAGGELGVGQWPELPPLGLSLVDLERQVIERVLTLKGGNVSEAARYLRVPRHILVYRIEKHGIAKPKT